MRRKERSPASARGWCSRSSRSSASRPSAPLGEEARHPRRAIPRAVIYSCLGIGLFYVLLSYAWVFGEGGITRSPTRPAASADPWRDLAKVFWGGGWVLVFAAIINSIIANSNAGFNAATRVFYAMARNGIAPQALARTHPTLQDAARRDHREHGDRAHPLLRARLEMGTAFGFIMLATAATVVVIIVYMLVMLGSIVFYMTEKRARSTRGCTWSHRCAGIVAVRLPALLPVLPTARLSGPVCRMVRARLDRSGDRDRLPHVAGRGRTRSEQRDGSTSRTTAFRSTAVTPSLAD